MDGNLAGNAPPAYGSVINQPNMAPPPGAPTAPPAGYPAGYGAPGNYPQPGQYPAGIPPNEPPPKYEPAKEQPMPAGQYPPGGYQAGYPTTIPQQTIFIAQDGAWSAVPKTIQCPRCRAVVTSGTEHKAGGLTWLACGLICLFGCWAGCCLIPFCLPDLQDVEHRCPNCNFIMGVYHRM